MESGKACTAVTWIRDGTLIDRMPENAAAFAITAHRYLCGVSIERLINWYFEKSGISALEKMRLFNTVEKNAIRDIENAAQDYTVLAEAISLSVDYFVGAPELVRELSERGVRNYITSAVQQMVLEVWEQSDQGRQVFPYMEILGDGPKGQKGKEHFLYVREQGNTRIYAVSDALSEIEAATRFADVPVGFAHRITRERVEQAFFRVQSIHQNTGTHPIQIDIDQVTLPDEAVLTQALHNAGAQKVIAGCRDSIIWNLRNYFVEEGLL